MRIVTTAVALLGAAGVMSGCSVQEPSPGCQVQDGTWQVAYLLKNPADASKSCGNLTGEAIGVFKYVTPSFVTPQPANPAYIGLRPQTAAELTTYINTAGVLEPRVTPDASVRTYPADTTGALRAGSTATALSTTLSAEPDSKGLCQATGFNTVTVAAKAVTDAKTGGTLPAQTVSYAFSNMNVYSAASAPGIQMEGTLVYGDGTGCQVEYRVLAQSPQLECDTVADCYVDGSGLNPDADVVCLPGINPDGSGGCVPNPDKGVPSFK